MERPGESCVYIAVLIATLFLVSSTIAVCSPLVNVKILTPPNKMLEALANGRVYATEPKEYYPLGHRWEGRWRGG
jgi:hypothetical protein